jgi:hypothetical protein
MAALEGNGVLEPVPRSTTGKGKRVEATSESACYYQDSLSSNNLDRGELQNSPIAIQRNDDEEIEIAIKCTNSGKKACFDT